MKPTTAPACQRRPTPRLPLPALCRALRLGAWLGLGAGAAPAYAGQWDVAALMEVLAGNPGGRVRFVETRHISLLDGTLESRGELVFVPPDRLERHTEAPQRESMVLAGGTLSLERGGRSHTLRLRDYPEVAALIDSIRATLAGDRAALERHYALSVGGSAAAWTLDLLPHDSELARIVLRISMAGEGAHVSRVDILQADGDRSSMRIWPPGQ